MISVEKAKELVVENAELNFTKVVSLEDALSCVIASSIYSPFDIPFFSQSAMDGYVFNKEDYYNGVREFQFSGEIQAGNTDDITIATGECYRIFTGAQVPLDGQIIVMQEKASRVGNIVEVLSDDLKENNHVRLQGEQLKKGDLSVPKGTYVTPATIGFLLSMGISEVAIYAKPNAAVVVTGDELKEQGSVLKKGEIFESNAVMLKMALKKQGIENIEIIRLKDDLESTKTTLNSLVKEKDLVLVSGGISVGDYDFVGTALNQIGVHKVFHKVKQKPGKPLYFGKTNSCCVFALPGNPAASLVGFYEYVVPMINAKMGKSELFLPKLNLRNTHKINNKGDRSLFLRGRINSDNSVTCLDGQGSNVLTSFSQSNALIYIEGSKKEVLENELVEVHVLPI